MNAVIDKPRAKAKRKAVNDAQQARMSKIHSALDEGHKKLYLAQQSVIGTDVGEPVEVLLTFVTESLLPQAIAPLQETPLTREIIDGVYTGMFPTLAALQGVIALARGTVIEATVRDAHDLLDEANSAMDFSDMRDPESRGSPQPAQVPSPKSPAPDVSGQIFDAYCITTQAQAILCANVSAMNRGAAYAARTLVQLVVDATAAADEQKTRDNCEEASCRLNEAIDVLELMTADTTDLVAEGVLSLLTLAKKLLDDNIGALP